MRLFDILLSAFALACFAPFGLVISVIQKFSGEGDIFYGQMRWGKDLKPFHLLKFSTMLRNSPNIGMGLMTLRNDPRVFPFGRFLRKTKLNEVPQLLNVLKGDMALVGPRPMVPRDIDFLPIEVQRKAYSVRPGLTGLGSIIFRDEEQLLSACKKPARQFYCEDIAPLKADIEIWYVEHRSLFLDFAIMFATAWVIVFPASRIYERLIGKDWDRFAPRWEALARGSIAGSVPMSKT